jgi:hypothetical protein
MMREYVLPAMWHCAIFHAAASDEDQRDAMLSNRKASLTARRSRVATAHTLDCESNQYWPPNSLPLQVEDVVLQERSKGAKG